MSTGIDKDDLRELINEVSKRQKDTDSNNTATNISSMFDALSKILITLITLGIVWLIGTTNNLQKENISIVAAQLSMKEDLAELKEFTKEPRFTKQDYISEVQPMRDILERHEGELNDRDDWMRRTEAQLSVIENDISLLKQLNAFENSNK